jgi:uncharacterized integral membrane protein (TIGR00697 family)
MRLTPFIAAMAAIVVASNIGVQFLLWDGLLTWGAFTYPFAFLVTDLANRLHGPGAARRVVLAGFAVGLVCSLIGTQVMLEFGPAVTLRVAVASGAAFLVAQLTDVALFDRLRQGRWWRAPLVSSLVSSVLDTAVFFIVAFSAALAVFGPAANAAVTWAQTPAPLLGFGAEAPLWVSLALADFGVKMSLAVIALIPFRMAVGYLLRARTV